MTVLIIFFIFTSLSLACGAQDAAVHTRGGFEPAVWVRTTGTDQALGIAEVPHKGDIVFTGRTAGGLGEDDGFVSYVSARGELEWTTVLGSAGVDVLLDVGVHRNGTIFVGGVSTGDYQDEPNTLFSDGALSALDPQGLVLWSRLIGMGSINQLVVDNDGIVVSGSGFQPGRQDADGFIAKYSLDGDVIWRTWVRSQGSDSATGLTITDGEIWVVGFTDGALFVDQGTSSLDGWIGRLDLEGRCSMESNLMRMKMRASRGFARLMMGL